VTKFEPGMNFADIEDDDAVDAVTSKYGVFIPESVSNLKPYEHFYVGMLLNSATCRSGRRHSARFMHSRHPNMPVDVASHDVMVVHDTLEWRTRRWQSYCKKRDMGGLKGSYKLSHFRIFRYTGTTDGSPAKPTLHYCSKQRDFTARRYLAMKRLKKATLSPDTRGWMEKAKSDIKHWCIDIYDFDHNPRSLVV
jgi:hypothetical protein